MINFFINAVNTETVNTVLQVNKINLGLLAVLMLYLYPIEVMRPRWLNIKHTLLLLSPFILLVVGIAIVKPHFRTLSSFSDIIQYSGEPNVLFRILIMSVFIPFSFLLYYFPYNWSKTNINYQWIRTYAIGIQGIAALYMALMFTGNIYVLIAHRIYCGIFALIITYQELYIRLYSTHGNH
ncbi:MAG: hypothetical protein RR015_00430, partial [Bacteroidales bacterium]